MGIQREQAKATSKQRKRGKRNYITHTALYYSKNKNFQINRGDVNLKAQASLSEGENDSSLTRITIADLCLSDKFSHLPCTLVQPSMHSVKRESFHVPEFARSFCHPIYPLGEQQWQLIEGTPLICLHSLQIVPSPLPPFFASQTVINCQPLMIHLQEEACLRISFFLADRIVVNSGDILPDSSVNSLFFTLSGQGPVGYF
ncbi:uncharacterized protein LOC107630132 isoform X2 [Arachis ipaensis]|uniref:uncharacterized protein LOC107630132 isoform X2 n=1 Tax=Arachis ipaensis TaxID=130454 RepID=UPI000A2B890B|nr:uncharacterized protein LOC107630132 isoform X2 [Arachis ipaensis]XP_025643746.1 uncharacterized protein LOC112737832 isoform X2 [Arachis hypogaea]